ncbi:pimeloyl-ACP methyl ester carboxylesterase [Desulfobotulus alkaliphilus]|uniref:Pimeloyl-ACP methyl ester carboxylesterase n=1 Tax=Desulfobotulus alkaliphilus TaxID=622671 RepID=A0A562RPZ1_9BACT|nr:alpha/beta hydrolase [Desulfobotulus alkaliphilus]TWI71135.1 pimeloyl-ACP methyl ester carboxylesterase [Desulfobotulus alkaliphilus]
MTLPEPGEGYIHHPEKGPLHYIDWGGEGPMAHLLHANGFCAGTYDPLIRLMSEKLHVIGSDVRGHGSSLSPVEMPIRHWKIFADDLEFMVSSLMQPPVIGIGHSLGAVTTLITAARHPELFSCIILMDPVILPRRYLMFMGFLRMTGLIGQFPLAKGARRRKFVFRGKQEALSRFTAGRGIFKTWDPSFVDAYLECGLLEVDEETAILKCDPELEAQIFESVPADIWSYAKKVQCPVLAIRGKKSDTFVQDAADRFSRTVKDCELVVVDKSGHFVPMEQPAICAEHILDFIKRKGPGIHETAAA